jgi:DNA-binding MarR family transcriptional regulator
MKNKPEFIPEMAKLFFDFFVIEKALANIFDRSYREHNITTKQWLVLVVALHLKNASISSIAEILSTSHQNVRVIAGNLVKNGLVKLVRSKEDRRTTFVLPTAKVDEINKIRGDRDNINMAMLFGEFRKSELVSMSQSFDRFKNHIENIKDQLI